MEEGVLVDGFLSRFQTRFLGTGDAVLFEPEPAAEPNVDGVTLRPAGKVFTNNARKSVISFFVEFLKQDTKKIE